jgi:hypothetical protein
MEGSSLLFFTDANPYKLSKISKNIIFNTKLLILNFDIAEFNYTRKFVQSGRATDINFFRQMTNT